MVVPKGHPDYKKGNELFRHMLSHFQPPEWAQVVMVLDAAAFAAKDKMKLIQARDKADSQRPWGFVFAIARTGNMADGKRLRNLGKHTPHSCYRQTWIPRLPDHQGRKTFWITGAGAPAGAGSGQTCTVVAGAGVGHKAGRHADREVAAG
jgi:hypothetical protein